MILGASRWEATRGVVQRSISAALAPTLQHMSVVGLVTIPSFMGGELLGGITPVQVCCSLWPQSKDGQSFPLWGLSE